MQTDQQYDLVGVKLPRASGVALRIFVALLESPLTGRLLIGRLLRQGGIGKLREARVDEPPTFQPSYPAPGTPAASHPLEVPRFIALARPAPRGFGFAGIRDYAAAYRAGTTTPEQVAERAIEAIADGDARPPALRAFIAVQTEDVIAQARASTERHRAGKPLGPLDGVPVAIKDEVDMLPYPTTVGTRFLGKAPAREDATVVARLRAGGAVLLGKANMHELGIGTTGLNPHHGTARNPYNPAHFTGGSSSGSAAAVAAGICPVALGADGGGSIRIPSSFCGLVGLKATYGRVSEHGAAPLCWSLAHLGPIAARAEDAALLYAILAGPDAKDANTHGQPPVTLEGFDNLDLRGLTLGVYRPWFAHASPAMVGICQSLLYRLEGAGATVCDVAIPELDLARLAHLVIITSEMAAAVERYRGGEAGDCGLDVRANLALARSFTASDYVQAQRIRTRTIRAFHEALEKVDAIVTPATGCTAPAIASDALTAGESDLTKLLEITRFTPPANLTGLPAIVFPAGYDGGLPVGLQAIGRPWEEHILLRLANAAEQLIEHRAPQVHYQLLPGSPGPSTSAV